MVSIALGRPLGVDDLDIDVAYPTEADDAILLRLSSGSRDQTPQDIGEEPHESTMSGFVALTKLCKIAGRVAHVLYRPSNKSVNDPSWANSQQNTINKLDKLLRDWLANDVVSTLLIDSAYTSLPSTKTHPRIVKSSWSLPSCPTRISLCYSHYTEISSRQTRTIPDQSPRPTRNPSHTASTPPVPLYTSPHNHVSSSLHHITLLCFVNSSGHPPSYSCSVKCKLVTRS